MPGATFMGVDILHEDGGAHHFNRDAKLFPELADDRSLRGFAELNRTAKWANSLHTSSIIQNFGSEKLAATPVQPKGLEANSGCRAPSRHLLEL